jgi:hypothetical protein
MFGVNDMKPNFLQEPRTRLVDEFWACGLARDTAAPPAAQI